MKTLSVIIPAFNEEDGIERVIRRVLGIRNALTSMEISLEFLIVDDGSSDRTAAVIAKYPEVRLVRHFRNRGYGAAIKTGFRYAYGDWLAFIDADATYPPESLPELCRAAIEQHADMVIGSRMSGARSEMPLTRRVGNIAYSVLLSLIGNQRVNDTTSGMRLLRREILETLYPLPDGLEFTPAMSTRAIHENLKVVEVPIPYAERVGRSKLSVVRDGFRFTNAIVWTALAYNPVRILGLISMAMLGGAGLIAAYILGLRLSGATALNAWQVYSILGGMVMAFAGVSLFSLGAMFNYLVSLFHKRPVRRGLFGKPVFASPLENHFGWFGITLILVGTLSGSGALVLSLTGWEIGRLWLYLVGSALLVMTGIQLFISRIVMSVLEELSKREGSAQRDLVEAQETNAEPSAIAPSHAGAVTSR